MRSSNWIVTRVFAVAALPFVLGAAYASYRTLYFKYAAAQAAGTVIEVTGAPPSLVVEYATVRRDAALQPSDDPEYRAGDVQVWRTESAGSDFYAEMQRGAAITVFYDPNDPADARIDHFIEHWVVPLFVGVPGALVLLAWLIVRRGAPRDPARMGNAVVAYPFSIIGAGLLIFAGYLFEADRRLVMGGETALGTIVDFRESWSRPARSSLSNHNAVHVREPVIDFTTRGGQIVRFVALSGSYPAGLEKGDQLDVLYLPDHPKTAEIKGSQRLRGGAQIVAILGAVSLAVGGTMVVSNLRRRRSGLPPRRDRRR